MKKIIVAMVLCCFFSASAIGADGLISIESNYSAKETANRFTQIVKQKGLTLFARINHEQNAASVDLKLRATELIIFGNPKAGTPLMQCAQTVAIDLPQKVLIWEDSKGKVWLSYNDPQYLRQRHKIKDCDSVFNNVATVLETLSNAAATK